MTGELIAKNEIINANWMYTLSANADCMMSCLSEIVEPVLAKNEYPEKERKIQF
jgi:hypothetical protein